MQHGHDTPSSRKFMQPGHPILLHLPCIAAAPHGRMLPLPITTIPTREIAMSFLVPRLVIPALLLALGGTIVSGAPLVSASQRIALDKLCAGSGSGHAATAV